MAAKLFKDALIVTKSGAKLPAAEALDGAAYVMLYFSAHWCPPCRGFTPEFAQWYATKPAGAVCVFVSSDRDQAAFDEYYSEMPWLALDFSARKVKEELSKTFGVRGIPTLVVLDATGALITKNGREGVSGGNVEAFPWAPAFPDSAAPLDVLTAAFPALQKASGDVPPASLAGKHLLVYSSAHWCGPCKKFTPQLKEAYEALVARGVGVEVVFISSDNDADEFKGYFADMPWAACPYEHEKFGAVKAWFDEKFSIEGIPNLLLFAPDGSLLCKDATGKVRADPRGERFPWPPEPVLSVEDAMDSINDGPVVIAFCGDAGDAAAAKAVLEPAAKAFFGKPGAPLFAVGKGDERGEGAIMRYCNLKKPDGKGARYVIIDVPKKVKAFLPGGDHGVRVATAAEIEAWVDHYVSGSPLAPTLGIKE